MSRWLALVAVGEGMGHSVVMMFPPPIEQVPACAMSIRTSLIAVLLQLVPITLHVLSLHSHTFRVMQNADAETMNA